MSDPKNKADSLTTAESGPGDAPQGFSEGAGKDTAPDPVSLDRVAVARKHEREKEQPPRPLAGGRVAVARQSPDIAPTDGVKVPVLSQINFFAGVFLLTLATLMLEIIQTRILSVVAWYHLAFFIISIAMFGMTAGAVWVYMRRDRFTEKTLSRDLAYFTTAFALSTALSLAVQMTLTPTVVGTATSVFVWVELAVCMAVPFFFSGLVVSLALTRSPYPIGRVYGFDLAGAAVGCLGVLLVLNSTDGPSGILWTAAIGAAAAVAFTKSGIGVACGDKPARLSVLRRPKLVLCVLAFGALSNSLTEHGLRPLAVKGKFETPGSTFTLVEWNTFSRVMVAPPYTGRPQMWGPSPVMPQNRWLVDQRAMNIDGDAGTTMYRFTGNVQDVAFLKYDVTNLVYFLPGRKRAAVIGSGGGRDLLSAWTFGLRDITAVEINPIFIKLLTSLPEFADFAGLNKLGGIAFVVDEARSWFARTDQSFDVIEMSLVDTLAATTAGAFTLTENGLYTKEAWQIFLERLTPRGVFSVSRYYAPGNVNETGRMVSLATAALMGMGDADPRRHIFLASAGNIATLLVSRSPISPADLKVLEDTADRYQYQVLISPTKRPASEVLHNIITASDEARLERYTASLELDLTPPTDERPFFFNQLPPLKILKMVFGAQGAVSEKGTASGNLAATVILLILFLVSAWLVAATIIIPILPAIEDVGARLVTGGTGYFMLIGIGFMTVEIGLLQRMTVFLGHPIYSLSVVLFTLILATGVGSFISDSLQLDSPRKFATWSILTGGYIIALPLWLPDLLLTFDSADLFSRAALCVGVIAPAAVLMGFGFPTGMRLISAVDRRPTPWFWAINGAAGVLASIIAVACSISFGISVTVSIGAVCYLLLLPAALTIGFRESAGAPGYARATA